MLDVLVIKPTPNTREGLVGAVSIKYTCFVAEKNSELTDKFLRRMGQYGTHQKHGQTVKDVLVEGSSRQHNTAVNFETPVVFLAQHKSP